MKVQLSTDKRNALQTSSLDKERQTDRQTEGKEEKKNEGNGALKLALEH